MSCILIWFPLKEKGTKEKLKRIEKAFLALFYPPFLRNYNSSNDV